MNAICSDERKKKHRILNVSECYSPTEKTVNILATNTVSTRHAIDSMEVVFMFVKMAINVTLVNFLFLIYLSYTNVVDGGLNYACPLAFL